MVHDLVQQAYGAMRHNRRRTALTMLGMQMMGFFPGRTSLQAGGSKAGVQIRFTKDDIQHVQELVPLVRHISPEVGIDSASVQNENRAFNFQVSGFYSQIQFIRSLDIDTGRFFNPDDEAQRARVAVIGSEAKTKLFSGQFAVGQKIRINGISFEVIGVLTPKMQEGDD